MRMNVYETNLYRLDDYDNIYIRSYKNISRSDYRYQIENDNGDISKKYKYLFYRTKNKIKFLKKPISDFNGYLLKKRIEKFQNTEFIKNDPSKTP